MSEILDVAHEMAKDLFRVGAMDEITMHEMDSLCLPSKRSFLPEDIRRIRTANHVSQAVFAVLVLARLQCSSGSRDRRNQAAQRNAFLTLLTARGLPRSAYSLFES